MLNFNTNNFNLERDISFLMEEDGLSFKEAYDSLKFYLNLEDYISFQVSRGVSYKIARKVFLTSGPVFFIPKLLPNLRCL